MKNLLIIPMRSQKGAKKELKKGAERKQAILAILAETPTITQTQLMTEMNLTRKQIQKDMKELQTEGVLVREGTNRSGRWVVKEYEK
jgi:ATP-dependent DNA helicase RecG